MDLAHMERLVRAVLQGFQGACSTPYKCSPAGTSPPGAPILRLFFSSPEHTLEAQEVLKSRQQALSGLKFHACVVRAPPPPHHAQQQRRRIAAHLANAALALPVAQRVTHPANVPGHPADRAVLSSPQRAQQPLRRTAAGPAGPALVPLLATPNLAQASAACAAAGGGPPIPPAPAWRPPIPPTAAKRPHVPSAAAWRPPIPPVSATNQLVAASEQLAAASGQILAASEQLLDLEWDEEMHMPSPQQQEEPARSLHARADPLNQRSPPTGSAPPAPARPMSIASLRRLLLPLLPEARGCPVPGKRQGGLNIFQQTEPNSVALKRVGDMGLREMLCDSLAAGRALRGVAAALHLACAPPNSAVVRRRLERCSRFVPRHVTRQLRADVGLWRRKRRSSLQLADVSEYLYYIVRPVLATCTR